jgi:hypothetical protein
VTRPGTSRLLANSCPRSERIGEAPIVSPEGMTESRADVRTMDLMDAIARARDLRFRSDLRHTTGERTR